ncbi:MAG TPA: glycerol-3-phosphate dehydrogenase/oxidase [Gemmatimonadaceae bacterium]|nr:glycerol-3-phosphate dehydrogenase/oxidase [Gemmatimonadaceae bacterium]
MADARMPAPLLGGSDCDMIVVGGGITGCGIARDAALRGVRVVLIEKNDFGSGTSSRSSRLVHGGVRYLEHGYVHLVFEASAERRRLLRLAPHLVRPLKFTWPVFRGARVPFWKVAAALTLYDLLALFRNVGRRRLLSAGWVRREQPALRSEGLVAGATYYDASTDDTRLTLAIALDAREHGATLLNHTAVEGLVIEHDRAVGVETRDVLTGERRTLRAPMIVNATGAWSDHVRALEGARGRPKVRGSKGVHIAVPKNRLGRGAFTLLSPTDGRVMFVLPGEGQTIVGTTDTFTDADPDRVRADEGDIAYLLAAANHFFPQANLRREDVISAWAGIRPLAASESGDPVSASREHVVSVTPAGVVTITGGKLTTYRVMAAEVVETALREARIKSVRTRTEDVPIGWNFPRPRRDVAALQAGIAQALREAGPDDRIPRMVIRYGAKWREALRTLDLSERESARVHPDHTYRFGDLRFACEHEAARTLGDLLIRRTHLAFERRDNARSLARPVAEYVAPLLGWSPDDVAAQLDLYEREVEAMFGVDP